MATWRDTLGKVEFQDGRKLIGASFRGVAFHVETGELAGGRRAVKHEYPLRDEPYVEDLGRKARAFPVEGYVVGDSYLARRDALIAALEQEGPGELVHPHYGKRRVICTTFRVRESTADGGLARFALEFEETQGSAPFPSATIDAEAKVAAAADAAWEAELAALQARYHVEAQPASALASLASVVASAATALDAVLAPLVTGTQELAALKRDLDHLYLDADALVRDPLLVASRVQAVLLSIPTLPLTPSRGAEALLEAYFFTPDVARPPATTTTRQLEQANYDALLQLVRSAVISHAVMLASRAAYDTYDAAVAARDALGDALDLQAEAASDTSYGALVQLRAELVRAVPGEGSDLPRLMAYTPPATVPSLVLAHQLYGDALQEADLVARNRVVRPGFVPGGIPLEVLARA